MTKNLPVGTAAKRNVKIGNSTPKAKKPSFRKRYFEVKIRIPEEDFARGQPFFHEEKYLSRYVLGAYQERVNRAEGNSKSARTRILAGNIELLLPIIKEMHSQGKLDFLKVEREK